MTTVLNTPPAPEPGRRSRSTPLGARGEPMVWLSGACLALCVVMIVSLLAVVVVSGSRAFWPWPIDTVTLSDARVIMGVPLAEESYSPGPDELAAIDALVASGGMPAGALDESGRPIRRLYRIGNREVEGQPFRWVPLYTISQVRRDPHATLLERQNWGVWIGTPAALTVLPEGAAADAAQQWAATVKPSDDPGAVIAQFSAAHIEAVQRRTALEHIKKHEVGEVNRDLERLRLRLRAAQLRLPGAQDGARATLALLSVPTFAGAIVLALACAAGGLALRRRLAGARSGSVVPAALLGVALLLCLLALLEHPWSRQTITPEQFAAARAEHDAQKATLDQRYDAIRAQTLALEAEDARHRAVFFDAASARFAPIRQTEPASPMLVSQVVRAVQPNSLDLPGKLAVYASRWREFLFSDPRESNTEGGIFPVIFGTVLLTLLLSVAVVPLGVVAALYLREYAKQGFLTSLVRIAVNNLAGVPSIVYGVFGLGFFCYSVGEFVDVGPADPWPVAAWWGFSAAAVGAAVLAVVASRLALPAPGQGQDTGRRWAAGIAFACWLACSLLAIIAIAGTPYFGGLYEAARPSPTFGTKGILWSALTLALLTLPVVIVATEEAVGSVPRSMREGSYGCGASKWQTIQRIVLPRAMPGIMTGMILAMSRCAGEVAPLMLVGAVKIAPDLAVSGHFPFLHLERSFMHLGFHIYDLGFQSTDSEAARPLVWCTTFVLIVLVVLLTGTAVQLRARLRRKYLGEQF